MPSHKKSKTTSQETPKVRKLSSSDPEARDEGPRLLPLQEEPRSHEIHIEANSRYIDLADAALHRKPPSSTRTKDPNQKSGTK